MEITATATAARLAKKGVDLRTILLHLESQAERPLSPAETAEAFAAWQACEPDRRARAEKQDADAAAALRGSR